VQVRLRDDRPVLLRRIRPADKGLLTAGLRLASPESVHARFLAPKARFTSRELRYLTEVDFHSHYALVATDARRPGRLLAVGRWVRDGERPDLAEVAVIVADDLHGQGLGTALGLALAEAAQARGVRAFTATILPENRRARRLLARIDRAMAEPTLALAA
jgi:acetyltransferase